MLKVIARSLYFASRVCRRLQMYALRPLFASHGINFSFDPHGVYTFDTIKVGNNVSLGVRPILAALNSHITIGNHVMFGPEVTIRGGNHRIDMIGRFMESVKNHEKRPEDDLGVVIEDDVWIGTRAIILHGVTIGRGAVIGAGTVVSKSIPPYAIAVGAPARIIRFRWNVETILEHESKLYPIEQRYSAKELYANQNKVYS